MDEKIISNYHSHIYLCRHADSTIEGIIKRAIKLGYTDIGISDHGPYPEVFHKTHSSRRMSYDEYYNIYLPDIKKYQELYKDKINVYNSLEIEYFKEIEEDVKKIRLNHDFLIFGEHVYYSEGDYKKFNDIKYDYNKCVLTKEELINYFELIKTGIKSGLFKILAHPDLFMIGYPIIDDTVKKYTKEIIELTKEYNMYIEFNCNGMRAKEVEIKKEYNYQFEHLYMYPRFDYWDFVIKECKALNIIISDDLHSESNLCDSYTILAYDYFKKNNYPLNYKIDFNKLNIKK